MCRLCSLQSAPALLQTVSSFTFQQHNVFMCYSSWFHTHLLAQVRSTNQLPSREPTQSFVEIWEVCMSAPLQASVIYPHTITPFPARSAETFRCIFAGVSFQASSLQTTGMSTCFFNASEKKKDPSKGWEYYMRYITLLFCPRGTQKKKDRSSVFMDVSIQIWQPLSSYCSFE